MVDTLCYHCFLNEIHSWEGLPKKFQVHIIEKAMRCEKCGLTNIPIVKIRANGRGRPRLYNDKLHESRRINALRYYYENKKNG